MKHLSWIASLWMVIPAVAQNTASGSGALAQVTTGTQNVAFGYHSLGVNIVGADNTGIGFSALGANNRGANNSALGSGALGANTTGNANSAVGFQVLARNVIGSDNVGLGSLALDYNTKGSDNAAFGYRALYFNSMGNSNTAIGANAGEAIVNGSNNIDIGANVDGAATDAGTIRIGMQGTQTATYIAGIQGQTVASGAPVYVDAKGRLGTLTSSRRFKDDIQPMGDASDALLALQPVTFHYKSEIDPACAAQFGLVAEDVAKVNPALVVTDAAGKPYSVRYEAVDAMLLNEFLKEHQRVTALEQARDESAAQRDTIAAQGRQISEQQKELACLQTELRALEAKLAPTR